VHRQALSLTIALYSVVAGHQMPLWRACGEQKETNLSKTHCALSLQNNKSCTVHMKDKSQASGKRARALPVQLQQLAAELNEIREMRKWDQRQGLPRPEAQILRDAASI
jgi:hypothetical protein